MDNLDRMRWELGTLRVMAEDRQLRPELRLAAVASAQGGEFTNAQARAAGWTKAAIEAQVRSGTWHRVARGVYVDRALWDGMDARLRHLCEVRARLLVLGPGWAAARRSAVLAHDLPYLGKQPQQPQLAHDKVRPGTRATSRHERIAGLPASDIRQGVGLQCTSLARTAVDLGRHESFRSAVVVADAALRRGLDRAVLLACAGRSVRWPGGPQAMRMAQFADGLSESPLESISRVAIADCGLPAPELQVEIWLGQRLLARVDKLWRGWNLVGEDDGRSKYDGADGFYAEKLREETLEDVGLEVVRWDWDTAWRPNGRLDAKIRRGMVQGSGKTLDPRVRFVTTTVADALRRTQAAS